MTRQGWANRPSQSNQQRVRDSSGNWVENKAYKGPAGGRWQNAATNDFQAAQQIQQLDNNGRQSDLDGMSHDERRVFDLGKRADFVRSTRGKTFAWDDNSIADGSRQPFDPSLHAYKAPHPNTAPKEFIDKIDDVLGYPELTDNVGFNAAANYMGQVWTNKINSNTTRRDSLYNNVERYSELADEASRKELDAIETKGFFNRLRANRAAREARRELKDFTSAVNSEYGLSGDANDWNKEIQRCQEKDGAMMNSYYVFKDHRDNMSRMLSNPDIEKSKLIDEGSRYMKYGSVKGIF